MRVISELRGVLIESHNLKLMAIQAMITQACFGMFNVVWQPYLLDLKTTFPQLGLIQGLVTFFTAVGAILWGRLSDIIGRKPVFISTSICRLIAIYFCLTATNWISFIGFGVFIGISSSWMHTNPNTSTLLAESVDKEQVGTALSIYSSLGTIVAIISAPVGGFLALKNGYRLIFLSCIAGELINSVFATAFLKETLTSTSTISRESNLADGLRKFLSPEKSLLPFYAISILDAVGWRLSFSNLSAILVDSFGLDTIQLGLIASTFSIVWGFTQAPVGVIIDRSSKRSFLILSKVCYILVALGYLLSRSFWVFLFVQIFNGLAHSFSIPAFTAMVLTRVPEDQRATSLGKLSTYPQVFGIIAPFIGGIIYEIWGFQILVILRIVFILISMAVIVRFVEERQ
jgi:MFS family permease